MTHWTREEIERFSVAVGRIIADHWSRLDELSVFPAVTPQQVERTVSGALPLTGADPHAVLKEFVERILPHCMTIPSPNYYGLINPAPTMISIFADALISAINQNVGGWSQSPSATALEQQVIQWLCQIVGYDRGSFGTFTTGGTLANITGLKCALHWKLPESGRLGLATGGRPAAFYVSEEAHFSLERAADLIGVGREQVRKIHADDRFHICLDDLVERIEADLQAGVTPCGLIGIAGTTSTGSIDPLDHLADIAERFGLWFHVDAAYGGGGVLSPNVKPLFAGLERADSITVDPHKWFYVPFEAGAFLVKTKKTLRGPFDAQPVYIPQTSGMTGEETLNFFQYGIQGSRRFNALKLWMSLKHLGATWYGHVVDRQIALCRHLAGMVHEHGDFETLSPVELGICCFRYFPKELRDQFSTGNEMTRSRINQQLDRINLRIQRLVEESGSAWFSTTVLKGCRALRINVLSYLTQQDHIDRLFSLISEKAVLASTQETQGR